MKYVKCYELPKVKTHHSIHEAIQKRLRTLFRGQGHCLLDIEIKNDLIYIWYDETKESPLGRSMGDCVICNYPKYLYGTQQCIVCVWIRENI